MRNIIIILILSILVSNAGMASDRLIIQLDGINEVEDIVHEANLESDYQRSRLEDNGSISFSIGNDRGAKNTGGGKSDDVGFTHGYKITFKKMISEKYSLEVSYSSNLYTLNSDPSAFNENYRNVLYASQEDSFWHTDQYFKESNLLSVILKKIKTKRSLYWSVGLGFNELNTNDNGRSFILSPLTQQNWYHHYINLKNGPTYREYNNLPNGSPNKQGVQLSLILGKDANFKGASSLQPVTGISTRAILSSLSNVSNIGVMGKMGVEIKGRSKNSLKLLYTINSQLYSDSYTYSEHALNIGYETPSRNVSLKVIKPISKIPNYMNPLPDNFENREDFKPAREYEIWVTFGKKL